MQLGTLSLLVLEVLPNNPWDRNTVNMRCWRTCLDFAYVSAIRRRWIPVSHTTLWPNVDHKARQTDSNCPPTVLKSVINAKRTKRRVAGCYILLRVINVEPRLPSSHFLTSLQTSHALRRSTQCR